MQREMLYIADEMFFSGTAAEITPIRSVDHIPVGNGRPGPITSRDPERVHGNRRRPAPRSVRLANSGAERGSVGT